VVATRFPEATHDVAASLEVITGADLRARGITTLRDALSQAAGITIAPGGDAGPASAIPEMWGLKEFDAFLLVVDDIPWGGALNPAVAAVSLRDVERIEILRGPAPVTYGATSFVGVIHVVHNAAAATARYVEAHGGTFGSGGAAADFSIANSGAWKARGTVDVDRQGYEDDRTSWSRGHALFRTSKVESNAKTWLSADINILRQDPATPHVREGASLSTNTPLDANYNPAGAYLNENRFQAAAGFERTIFHGATWGTMASFAYSDQSMFRGFLTDVSNTANNASGYKETIGIHDFYADTHLIFPSIANVKYMIGADILMAGGEAKGATFTYTTLLNGSTKPVVAEPTLLDKDAGNDRMFVGGYASAEWRPTPRVGITAGLRMNVTNESRGEGAEVSHARPSGSIGAIVGLWEKDVDHVRVFANYRNTFKPAAFDFSLAENEGVLDPETSSSYEGGLKLRTAQGRLDVEASYFHMDFSNLVVATVVGGLPALTNSGKTRFQGVELATDLRLPNSVTARASYSMHDGKFVDYITPFDGVLTQLGGKRFEMSAKALASAGLTYAPVSGLIAHASFNYTGDRYLNKRNTALASPFSTFDAGIGYRFGDTEIRIDGRNLSNRRDPLSESEFGDAQYYRMTARTIMAGVSLKY
jgi:outer membrane receptor protein involved in Fe transport